MSLKPQKRHLFLQSTSPATRQSQHRFFLEMEIEKKTKIQIKTTSP